jgi:hypothetical protein
MKPHLSIQTEESLELCTVGNVCQRLHGSAPFLIQVEVVVVDYSVRARSPSLTNVVVSRHAEATSCLRGLKILRKAVGQDYCDLFLAEVPEVHVADSGALVYGLRHGV